MDTHSFVQWWWIYPSASMSNIAPPFRPVIAFSFELLILCVCCYNLTRQMRGFLKLRPLVGLVASSILILDVIGALFFGFTSLKDGSPSILYDWISESIASSTAVVCICSTLFINFAAFSTSAYWVLAHDRSEDGDVDGTDTPGETSGGGSSGTGVSTYRQTQLVHLRAAIWPKAALPKDTDSASCLFALHRGNVHMCCFRCHLCLICNPCY